MIDEAVPQLFGDLLLQGFQFGVDEFDHLAAFDIDQMVVMRLGSRLVPGTAITEIVPVENAGLFEQANGAIDGGDRNARIDFVGTFVEHFHIGMIVAFGQDPGNDPALFGNAQTLVGAKLFEIDTLVQTIFLNE